MRIGMYAGTFDPIHSGHIGFALQAIAAARLDLVYFLPERQPRHKKGVEHFGHRVAMIKKAIQPHPQFRVLELVDVNFSVQRTLPRLRQQFANSELVFLMGSDVIASLHAWPHIDSLLKNSELVIGLRHQDERSAVHAAVEQLPTQPRAVYLFESHAPDISSGKVRQALRKKQQVAGVLKSVERYSDRNWLYISLA